MKDVKQIYLRRDTAYKFLNLAQTSCGDSLVSLKQVLNVLYSLTLQRDANHP